MPTLEQIEKLLADVETKNVIDRLVAVEVAVRELLALARQGAKDRR
jgi:hypothetical protein